MLFTDWVFYPFFALCFAIRGAAIMFHIRFGIVGEPILTMRRREEDDAGLP